MQNSLSVPVMEETESCKAVLEQGVKKGHRCWRPPTTNGYCGKHQTQATIDTAQKDGMKKCKRYRCTHLISITAFNPYCQQCIEEKKQAMGQKKICIALIEQGLKKGEQCDKVASHEDYCGKHYEANKRREEALAEGIRICDGGKRACKNQTKDRKLRCESCLEKDRKKEMDQYYERKDSGNKCVTCGKDLQDLIQGLRSETIHQCEGCYNKSRNIEIERHRDIRNYREDRKSNMLSHYNMYIRSASTRNLDFTLSLEIFDEIVNQACHYCGYYNEKEANGIDRINSTIGYFVENIVPCCGICNRMKNDQSFESFIKHVEKIHTHMAAKESIIRTPSQIETKKSYIRPSAIVKLYTTNKLMNYIDICKADGRSPLFIQKLLDAQQQKVNEKQFRHVIKNALISEYNSEKKTNDNVRHRIPKKELFGYLDMNRIDLFIKVFENVHGKEDGFAEDVNDLSKQWTKFTLDEKQVYLNKLLIKYQNIRNRKKDGSGADKLDR